MSTLTSFAEAVERLRPLAEARGTVVVLYCLFDRAATLEGIYGWEKLDIVLATSTHELARVIQTTSLRDAILTTLTPKGDAVVLLLARTEATVADTELSPTLMRSLRDDMASCLEKTHGADIASLFDLYIGRSVASMDPKLRFERIVSRCIRDAAGNARTVEQRERAQLIQDLRETLRTRAVYTDYDPIVSAADGHVVGYEALSRGRLRSLRRPELMFEVAASAGLIWELSALCRERAIEGMDTHLRDGELLFLNIDPHDFANPGFHVDDLAVPDPTRIVIEITERTAIRDYPTFRERLRAFRERGFRFAVDDAGSGYAGLGSIANLEPDFIKLDLSLITGIDTNFLKQDLVKTLVHFANDQGASVIAEGVERQAEYDTVRSLGVHLVQGFLLRDAQQPAYDRERPVGGT